MFQIAFPGIGDDIDIIQFACTTYVVPIPGNVM